MNRESFLNGESEMGSVWRKEMGSLLDFVPICPVASSLGVVPVPFGRLPLMISGNTRSLRRESEIARPMVLLPTSRPSSRLLAANAVLRFMSSTTAMAKA